MKRNSSHPSIGLDLMGGEHKPEVFFDTISHLETELDSPIRLFVFCNHAMVQKIEAYKTEHSSFGGLIELMSVKISEVIHMEDDPLVAIRQKRESSIGVGMRMLQRKELDAFLSTGNTGALLASAKLYLPSLPNITRPALLALFPTRKGPVAILDVGANVTCKTEHLIQFAMMGIAYQKIRGIKNPTVGILNIGSEEKKGRIELQETYQFLQKYYKDASPPIFKGNLEGHDVFSGKIDVLITDGFTGNIFLKTSEGMARFVLDKLQKQQITPPYPKDKFAKLESDLNYSEYLGALFCGVDGIAVKCHCYSDSAALLNGIRGILNMIQGNFISKMKEQLNKTGIRTSTRLE